MISIPAEAGTQLTNLGPLWDRTRPATLVLLAAAKGTLPYSRWELCSHPEDGCSKHFMDRSGVA